MAESNACRVTVNGGHAAVACRKGLTLFAGLRTGDIFLPTGCGARGACGQCRVRVIRGGAGPLTDNEKARLGRDEMQNGYRLACQLRLAGDIDIEVSPAVLAAREYAVKTAAITPLTHDIRRFSFVLRPGERIAHQAGQFVNFVAPAYGGVTGRTIRCFSFATASDVEDRVDVIVRRTPSGACTTYLFDHLKEGDGATLIAPFGDFHLRDTNAPCIWIAGGSGLSPFLGMVQDLVARGRTDRRVRLFFGAVRERDLYYVAELKGIAEKHPWFSYIPALSGSERCAACADYGLVTDVVARRVPEAADHEAYLCGGPGMIEACITTLVEKGVRRENIYFDRFG